MKATKSELAIEFRHALATDLTKAESFLRKHPIAIDSPVFGDSESALHFFAVENRPEVVGWLLAHGAKSNGIGSRSFPLHEAAQLGNLEVCLSLLGAGANPNLQDCLDETALHKASGSGRLEIIELLLSSGADPTIPETCGELPIDKALPRKRAEILAMFERHAAKQRNEEA